MHRQNCHGYALDISAWINNPIDIYNKEFDIVDNVEDANIIFYTSFGAPTHSAKYKNNQLQEKYGVTPSIERKYRKAIFQKQFFLREKP